jgi:hypothetical protein
LRLGFPDDGEDLDFCFCDVIEHPNLIDAQSILRLLKASETLDSALAHLCGLEPQVDLKGIPDLRSFVGRQGTQLLSGARREGNLEPHSGQSIARIAVQGKVGLTAAISCEAHIDDAGRDWDVFSSALRLLHPFVRPLLRYLRQLA